MIAPETDRDEAEDLARRLREGIERIQVEGSSVGACTGCAVFPEDGSNVDRLLSRADDRLRVEKEAKQS